MPRMDGLEATRAIRQLGGARGAVMIVALTANAFADDVKACRDAGMDDFVAKPIRKQVLITTLSKIAAQALSLAPAPARAFDPPAVEQAVADEEALIDRSILAELCDEIGEEGGRAILEVFLNETRGRIALLEALATGTDRAAIEVEAHTLKGAAGSVGFARVSMFAKAVEFAARAGATTDYAAEVARIKEAFAESCREIEARPLTGAARAA
jgi:HPt (histidine-containing phosphotransfer) domain-containing protein